MIIKREIGCCDQIITIDGVDIVDLNSKDLQNKIVDYLNSKDVYTLIHLLLDNLGETKFDSDSCNQCGHTGSTTMLSI
jgi:hypothetical protein